MRCNLQFYVQPLMLIAYLCISKSSSMTDSMKFGPEWLRALSSEGSTGGGGTRYQLADYRYGREEMLALFEKGLRAPNSLSSYTPLYSEQVLPPLALLPQTDEERSWTGRSAPPGNSVRGRGTASLDRGGRGGGRGRGPYQTYARGGYDSSGGWVGTETTTEWSPRKDYTRAISVDNWRRHRSGEEDEGWRANNPTRIPPEKWGRSTSWRDGGDGSEERGGPPLEKSNRASWQEGMRGTTHRRPWENEDHLPEWAMENSIESGGSFDSSGAFHGCSDDEQREHKHSKRDVPLQKSISQQNITVKSHPTTLPSSQSAISLSKPPDDNVLNDIKQETTMKDTKLIEEKQKHPPNIERISKPKEYDTDPPKIQNIQYKEPNEHKQHFHNNRIYTNENNIDINGIHSPDSNNRVDEEFERSQEDFVKKLVVDEDMPKKVIDNFMLPTVVPPPNLAPPTQDNWYYQDPQGDLQGPFPSSEMAEWFRAGYFTSALLVKRLCDEAFYRLGDLVTKCGGNPFQSNVRIAPLKQEIVPPVTDELLKYQLLQRQLLRHQAETMRALSQNEGPWVMPQQRDLVSQQVLTHPQITPSDMQFFQQQQQSQPQPVSNPLMNMINQMQQANKLPSQMLGKKPSQLDPIHALVQQMGGLQTLPNTGPSNSGLPTNIPTSLQNSGHLNNFSNLPTSLNSGTVPVGFTGLNSSGLHNAGSVLSSSEALNTNGLNVGLTSGMTDGNRLPPRPNPLGAVDSLSSTTESDPLKNLLQQLQSKQQTQQLDSLWQQNQFTTTQTNTQWQPNEVPISMWDLQHPPVTTSITNTVPLEKPQSTQLPQQTSQSKSQEKERQRLLKENLEKEQKRQKELDEKQAKKEAEEKRKEEQRRQEAEKKAAEEKRKKEEERIKKELEKARKEAEEKRLRELEEKRRLKEQRKAEEEARRRMEDQKKSEEVERVKREIKEKEEQLRLKHMEAMLQQQQERQERELSAKANHRVVPWSQPSSTPELSLADIQRAEREKRAEQAAQLQQQRAQQNFQQEQSAVDKQTIQLSWTKKSVESKSIKSFAEIQQEEHERFTKQTAELRAALKEKEASIPASVVASATPWTGQGLSWATSNQWNNNIGGFWDDGIIQTQPSKPSALSKSSSTTAIKQVIKQSKNKLKKEEQQVMKLFSNGPVTDEFTEWCTSTLTRLHSTVDIPTFINFLRDIESALEVKDYCKEYFGDVPATQQFVTQFLEKRRMFKPKRATQTDDMSSPAPAITPCIQHSAEFQEVKGKAKKSKKSKMIKVDARNLGFSVTAAPDRINVGDRDYVEN